MNRYRLMIREKMSRKDRSRLSKVISHHYCVVLIPISQCIFGTFKKTNSPFALSPRKTIQNAYHLKIKPDVMQYLHATAGFPTEATWYAAVQAGNCNSWPWLNQKNVRAHFPESEETQKGHMQNTSQGLQSTKKRVQPVEEVDSPPRDTKKQDVFTRVFDLNDEIEGKIYTDQTG